MNRGTRMVFRSVPVLVCLILSILLTGCATDRQVISQAEEFHSGLQPAVMNDPQLANYMQSIGKRIIAAAKTTEQAQDPDSAWMFSKDMRFHLVNSKTVNAFTTGGEHMYVYNALFQQCKTEDELAAVMAHEYAHVYGRHVHKGMNRQYAIMGAAALAGGAGYVYGGQEKGQEYAGLAGGAALLAGQFVGMSYTRSDEAEADELGFQFYTRAGWDPNRFGDFFAHMIEMGYDKGPELLSDHPSLQSRLEASRQRAASLPPAAKSWRRAPVASPAQFRQLQLRAEEVAKRMPSDRSLEKTQELLAAMPRSCWTPAIHEDQKKAEIAVMRDLERSRRRLKPAR